MSKVAQIIELHINPIFGLYVAYAYVFIQVYLKTVDRFCGTVVVVNSAT
jgi:hypothetical protein